jgi:hypothetical protein
MKHFATRALTIVLAAVMLASVCACGKLENKDKGYIINMSNQENPKDELSSFVEGNLTLITDIAKATLENGNYVYYDFQEQMVDESTGELRFVVQENNGTSWRTCKDELINRLTEFKFVGAVLYEPEKAKGVVVIVPRMTVNDKTVYLVYCTNAAARRAVKNGAFSPDKEIQFKKITGNWYCVIAE